MLVVMALGGDTPLRLTEVARAIASIASEHAVVVTHRNGPRGQLLAKRTGSDQAATLGVNARTLERVLDKEMPGKKITSLVTDVEVRLVPVGPHYADTPDGRGFAATLGWMVVQDETGFRRCIPTSEPLRITQLKTVKAQIEAGGLLICSFGAGIAIAESEFGQRKAAAQIDEDLAAALLAEQIGADLLMLMGNVDVERVQIDWPRGAAPPLRANTDDALRRVSLELGLIGPKAEAACRFVEATGKRAAIGAFAHAGEILRGDRGVQIAAKASGVADMSGGGRSVTVLVVDDNQIALRVCRRVLEKAGHTVLTASDGLEGVSLALANSPDFILMDVAMPGMDGIEAMRRIKEQRPGIPIVVASAHLLPSDRERFLALGAADMLIPPFRLTDLTEVVARFTARGVPPSKPSYEIGPTTNPSAIEQGDRGAQVAAKASGVADMSGGGRSVTVLVVDDNEVAVRLCRRVLEKAGYRVVSATDGLGAVSMALAHTPDMILLDDAMPGMNGLEAMRMIKQQRPGTPIAMTTAHAKSAYDREMFLKAGADDVMIKPFRLSDLIEMAVKLTGHRAAVALTTERRRTIPEELRRIVGRVADTALWNSPFPISTAQGKPQFDFGRAASSVADFLVALTEISPLLDEVTRAYEGQVAHRPELSDAPGIARLVAKKTASRLFALAQSIAFESNEAGKEHRDWSWTGAESMFRKYERPAMDETNECDWDELLQGEYMPEFEIRSRALIELVQRLLVSPPKPYRQADEIRRPGSAHEEHVYGAYRWCAVCGWIELMAAPIGIHTLVTTPPGGTAARSVAKLEDQALKLADQALEARDPYTDSHSSRVEDLAGRLALQLKLGAREWDLFRKAGALHDIGKIGIPDQILKKRGRLSDEEWTIMRRHSDIGADLIEKSSALREIASIVRHHHERWDGSGYPKRMKGDAIPLGARIIAVAESFDWLTHPPSFLRRPMDVHEALRDIRKRAGSWYDPEVVTALREIHRAHQS